MHVQLIRHATLRVTMGGHTLLVDPMLSDKEAMDPIQNSSNNWRNPLVALPFSPDEILKNVTAVLVTHTHRDHWDPAATELVPKTLPILCQPEDTEKFTEWGFTDVRPVKTMLDFEGLQFTRTGGQHGTGDIGRAMAPVSGFVIRAEGEPSIYIAGDTIYCAEVEDAINRNVPNVIVVNAGGAKFNLGDPITMTAKDVAKVVRKSPEAKKIAVHMEAINHCHVKRAELEAFLERDGLRGTVEIPSDGATVLI